MKYQRGFTLFELMIAIAVIAILSAMAVPAYQGYIQKAALTDVLQTVSSYRTAIELCYLDDGGVQSCNSNQRGIPASKSTRYVSAITVAQGRISITGQSALQGLSITLTPHPDSVSGELIWRRNCSSASNQESMVEACKNVLRFDDDL